MDERVTDMPTVGDESVDDVLREHVLGLCEVLADDLVAVWLHGSLAHGGFGEHSDIDFLVVVRAEPDGEKLDALREHHRRLHDSRPPWSRRLEGSYAPVDEVRCWRADDEGWWYVDNGARELERSRHDDTLVVRATLLDDGLTLFGIEPHELIDPVDRDELRGEVRDVMVEWGRALLGDPAEFSSAWYQRFSAISYARMVQTVRSGRVESKIAAGEWAARNLEPRWADLVRRALEGRGDPPVTSRAPADEDEVVATRDFIRHALALVVDAPELVRAGYDAIAGEYLAARDRSGESGDMVLLRELLAEASPGSTVLDVGCGAGDPVALEVTAHGHHVVGVDISAEQVRRAREAVPDGEFVRGDVTELEFDADQFDLIVAFFSLFHVPRESHGDLFVKFRRWLKPGGTLAATVGRTDSAGEVEPAWLGTAPMYWSHFGLDETVDTLQRVGFEIVEIRQVPETLGTKRFDHPFAVARRPGSLGCSGREGV